jgi:hypothetical protein
LIFDQIHDLSTTLRFGFQSTFMSLPNLNIDLKLGRPDPLTKSKQSVTHGEQKPFA